MKNDRADPEQQEAELHENQLHLALRKRNLGRYDSGRPTPGTAQSLKERLGIDRK